jgi:hypothetical protein
VRVPRDEALVAEQAPEEAVDDLAEAVALGLGALLDRGEPLALDELGDEHPPRRQRRVDLGDAGVGMAAEDACDAALVLRLDLVVELLADAVAQLTAERLDVEARREALHEREEHVHVAQVGVDRLRDARVLDLHRHVAALVRAGAVDLADRRGRHGRLVERLRTSGPADRRAPRAGASRASRTGRSERRRAARRASP